MTTARIHLGHRLSGELAAELAKRIFFIAPEIEEFALVTNGDGTVEAVDLTLGGPAGSGSLEAKINRVVAEEIATQRALPPKEVWRSSAARAEFTDAFPLLLRLGLASVSGEGQVAFGEPLIGLLEYLDRQLRDIALSQPAAREFRYPTLLPASALERIGYYESFPHFAMFVTRLHNDADVYRSFIGKFREQRVLPDDLFGFCGNRDYCLPPTMCYHTYHQHQGRQLDADMVVTSRGKSFRYESRYHAGLERLWDFTIREIVFLGSQGFVTACRDAVMRQAFGLMERLELAGSCAVANDHFFADAATASKIFSQRMMELKLELRLPVASGRDIAAGSFNLHGRFFGESFGIRGPDGEPVASGCAGFGLERLVHAFLCQHGLDPSQWPAAVRRDLG